MLLPYRGLNLCHLALQVNALLFEPQCSYDLSTITIYFKGGAGGRVINIASLAGILISPEMTMEAAGYVMAKWGAVALTRSFATCKPSVEEAEGVKAYALCPWFADTELVRSSEALNVDAIEKKAKVKVYPTGLFAVLEPQNSPIDISYPKIGGMGGFNNAL